MSYKRLQFSYYLDIDSNLYILDGRWFSQDIFCRTDTAYSCHQSDMNENRIYKTVVDNVKPLTGQVKS